MSAHLKCIVCGFEWEPKVEHPLACPHCNSRRWDRPPKYPRRKKAPPSRKLPEAEKQEALAQAS